MAKRRARKPRPGDPDWVDPTRQMPVPKATLTHTTKGVPREKPLKTDPIPHRKPFDPETMCGAQMRRRMPGTWCQNPKGYKTPHLGEGRCWLHGGLSPIKHGLGSLITHGRLKDLLQKIKEQEHAIMDLTPEVDLMRAMVIDYVNRYDDFIDQLDTWYNALDEKQRKLNLPPIPRKYPDLEDAGQLLESITRMVERMHKIQREGSITLDVFRGVMSQMGMAVAKHCSDDRQLQKIEEEWSQIMVDPKSFVRGSGASVPNPDEDSE